VYTDRVLLLYSQAVKELFEALDKAEKLLSGKDYLVANKLTEADIRLWVSIVRMDGFFSVLKNPYTILGFDST
jgi:glutathionyl-hydroquinone reductase